MALEMETVRTLAHDISDVFPNAEQDCEGVAEFADAVLAATQIGFDVSVVESWLEGIVTEDQAKLLVERILKVRN